MFFLLTINEDLGHCRLDLHLFGYVVQATAQSPQTDMTDSNPTWARPALYITFVRSDEELSQGMTQDLVER